MARSKAQFDDDRLIEQYIDPNWDRYAGGRADARLKDYGVSVWALKQLVLVARRRSGLAWA